MSRVESVLTMSLRVLYCKFSEGNLKIRSFPHYFQTMIFLLLFSLGRGNALATVFLLLQTETSIVKSVFCSGICKSNNCRKLLS